MGSVSFLTGTTEEEEGEIEYNMEKFPIQQDTRHSPITSVFRQFATYGLFLKI